VAWSISARTLDELRFAIGNGNKYISRQGNIGILPAFKNCTQVLSRETEATAIELYWDVVSNHEYSSENAVDKLQMSSELDPWFFECHILLAQKYLHRNENERAKAAADRAMELQIAWGTAYDKRMSFPAWVAWTTRVLHNTAAEQTEWPQNSWEVNNFGMVPIVSTDGNY